MYRIVSFPPLDRLTLQKYNLQSLIMVGQGESQSRFQPPFKSRVRCIIIEHIEYIISNYNLR